MAQQEQQGIPEDVNETPAEETVEAVETGLTTDDITTLFEEGAEVADDGTVQLPGGRNVPLEKRREWFNAVQSGDSAAAAALTAQAVS